MQRHFDIVLDHVSGCQFRGAEVMRRRSSEFRDHDAGPAPHGGSFKIMCKRGRACGGLVVVGVLTSKDGTSSATDRTRGRIPAGNMVPIRDRPPVRSE